VAEAQEKPTVRNTLTAATLLQGRERMKQDILYGPIKAWLESKGFRVIVAGERRNFVIPISDLFAAGYKTPDLVGVNKNNRVVVTEVEKDKERFFDALGRCMLWRCTATFVYLAYPKNKIARAPFLDRLGIGLLEVEDESHAVSELVGLPREDTELTGVLELHPTDFVKEQRLAAQIRNSLG